MSLQEQKAAIEHYAHRFGLNISQWFEERETAAKRGRPIFTQMLRLLRQKKARGVVIHKIDRSARNLKDWADLGEMIDSGVEVQFANEGLDLNSRGGRLSADIQAVVAADYIRNLREETKKGFYGRLKQGFYPIRAPIGYLDQGKAKAKIPDPVRAPLVIQAFELYATEQYSLPRLLEEMRSRGLTNRHGGKVSLPGLSTMLNNPFYIGLMRIKKRGEVFPGKHEPLVSKFLFDKVQAILRGKTVNRTVKHDFTFRRMIRCSSCSFALIGELQKGHVYYRCQTKTCPTKTIREEEVNSKVLQALARLEPDDEEMEQARLWVGYTRANYDTERGTEIENCKKRLSQMRPRLARLTDAFLEGILERDLFSERKQALLCEEKELQETLANFERPNSDRLVRLQEFLELAKSAKNSYALAVPEQRRRLIKNLTSNLTVMERNVMVELKPAAQVLADRSKSSCCGPNVGIPRTLDATLDQMLIHFSWNAAAET